jgi:hypothetical protein
MITSTLDAGLEDISITGPSKRRRLIGRVTFSFPFKEVVVSSCLGRLRCEDVLDVEGRRGETNVSRESDRLVGAFGGAVW